MLEKFNQNQWLKARNHVVIEPPNILRTAKFCTSLMRQRVDGLRSSRQEVGMVSGGGVGGSEPILLVGVCPSELRLAGDMT